MSKWLMEFENQNDTPIVKAHDNNCTNCTGVHSEKTELLALNQRWEKAIKLEKDGFFEGKSPDYQEKACQALRQICARAGKLWEIIIEACPHQKHDLNELALFDF